jgi:hypothetical protein
MIEWATFQLFEIFQIDWRMIDPYDARQVDELVYAGGGSMGTLYQQNWEMRGAYLGLGVPITILPQSFTSPEPRPYETIYVREAASLDFEPRAQLAPDLALGLEYTAVSVRRRACGVFLRRDGERAVRRRWFTSDPAKRCRTPREYLELAAQFDHVITDRLHFAICALIVGRRVTLLPNSYHKNRSMYETWLAEFGCEFAQNVDEALASGRAA